MSITPALARAEAPAPSAASAKDELARGTALYKEGNYVDAAQAFILAYKLKPKAVILYNIGQAYRKMGALDGALAYYQRFLKEAPASERAPLEAETRKHIAELEPQIEARQREEKANADAERAARERRARETAAALAADRERLERDRLATPTTPPPGVVEPRTDGEVRTEAPKKKIPIYKSAALWAPVGVGVVVIVALGVGLGIGLKGPDLGVRTAQFP